MRRGLVTGAFLPLHRGHELLIDTALAECDDVTVVVYDNHRGKDMALMPIEKRLGWVRMLYPDIENIVALPDPWEGLPGAAGPEYAARYAEQVGFLGRFDRFYSSEHDYWAFAEALGAEHVVVDGARALVPISGTVIRSAPYRYRGLMHPDVYASLIRKVVFVGTESTGKTTIARACAEAFDTRWVHEFGRELWEAQDLQGSFADHVKMATRQRRRELAAARHSKRYLFCDTNAWTTLHWSLMAYGVVDPRLEALVEETKGDYLWFLCDNDFGWVQDGTRELAGGRAAAFQRQQEDDLIARRIPFVRLSGSLEERVKTVGAILGEVAAVAV